VFCIGDELLPNMWHIRGLFQMLVKLEAY